jgi:hypothetical protein
MQASRHERTNVNGNDVHCLTSCVVRLWVLAAGAYGLAASAGVRLGARIMAVRLTEKIGLHVASAVTCTHRGC